MDVKQCLMHSLTSYNASKIDFNLKSLSTNCIYLSSVSLEGAKPLPGVFTAEVQTFLLHTIIWLIPAPF